MKVMIVDDAEDIRELITAILEMENHEVVSAAHGQDALDKLSGLNLLPTLILLDIMMPVMDGFQFLKEKSKDPKIAMIPVMAISAGSFDQEIVRKTNVQKFMTKPLDLDELVLTVHAFA